MSGELTPFKVAIEDLRASAEDMEQAAWREGIDPGGPLGIWVITLRRSLVFYADIAEKQVHLISGVVADTRGLVDAEVEQLRLTNVLSVRAMDEAKIALSRAEINAQNLMMKSLNDLAPKILAEIRSAVVIRERRYNRKVEWGRALLVGCMMLGLVVGGYVWHGQQDGGAAAAALVRCMQQPLQAANRDKFCSFATLFQQ